jgi:hypothetical protein
MLGGGGAQFGARAEPRSCRYRIWVINECVTTIKGLLWWMIGLIVLVSTCGHEDF